MRAEKAGSVSSGGRGAVKTTRLPSGSRGVEVAGVPGGVGGALDPAAAVAAGAVGQGVELADHGRDRQGHGGAGDDLAVGRAQQDVLEPPAPQVDQQRHPGRSGHAEQIDEVEPPCVPVPRHLDVPHRE